MIADAKSAVEHAQTVCGEELAKAGSTLEYLGEQAEKHCGAELAKAG